MPNYKILFNVLAQFSGKIGTVLASFIVVKIISSFGKDFYGNYVTAYEFLAFFGILADSGLFAVAVRDLTHSEKNVGANPCGCPSTKNSPVSPLSATRAEAGSVQRGDILNNSHHPTDILGNILAIRLLFIFIAIILACTIAQLVPTYAEIVKIGIYITSISMGLSIIAGTLSSVLQAKMKIQYFSGSLVIGKIILAALVFYISQHLGIFGITPEQLFLNFLWAGVFSNIVFCALVTYFVQKEISIKLKFDKSYWQRTLKKSLPYGMALVLQTLYLRADLVLISLLLSAEAVGVYGVSARILESFLVLGVFFGQALLPKLSEGEKSKNKTEQTLVWALEKLLIIAIPVIIGVFLFAPQIITILSSENYLSTLENIGSENILRLLIPTIFFAFFNQVFTFTLVTKEKQKYLLLVNFIALMLNVSLNIYFLPIYGIISAAISTIFCEIIVWVLLFSKILKYFTLKFNYQNLLIIFFINLITFLPIILINAITFAPNASLSILQNNLLFALIWTLPVYLLSFYKFRKRFL